MRTQIVSAAISAVIALGLAELGARLLAHDAFPYLNVYVTDARYGVRLAPSTTTRTRSRLGRITTITTNSRGFRGPEPTQGGVFVLGDSQMLGYGVDLEDATFSRLGASAIATPTWGPIEFARAVEDLAPELHPRALVFVANLANDWPESNVENVRRNQSEDGWVVARRPFDPLRFPGRDWLMSRSQLVFAARAVHALGNRPIEPSPADRLLLDLPMLARPRGDHRSLVTPHLARVIAACDCLVIAAVLPLDVEVDAEAWKKYASTPHDLAPLDALREAFLTDAVELGATPLDLRTVLGPGSFLPDDVHLSPTGHAAIASALATALDRPLAQGELR